MKKILIVNDDGIRSPGIEKLAELALPYGEVTVVAPRVQCSGNSQCISITNRLHVRKESFPVQGVEAYSVDGTPADCAMVGCTALSEEKPDIVFSGINDGYNTGIDILYSGTIGAAMEALCHGVKAIAFSLAKGTGHFQVIEQYFDTVMKYAEDHPAAPNQIWNINFPGVFPEQVKGISYGVRPAQQEFYDITTFDREEADAEDPDAFYLIPRGRMPEGGPAGTDMGAVLDGYIAVGLVENCILEKK